MTYVAQTRLHGAFSGALPEPLRDLMAEIGPRWATDIPAHVRLMIDQFSALVAKGPKQRVKVARSESYGTHERQRVDVFTPEGSKRRPVVIFVHGGAFVDGDRNRSPEIYANVLYYFARHQFVGVNMEYRLAPEHRYPSGIEDVSAAVRWVRQNIDTFGGDPDRVFLIGHSAGAAHAAGYAYDVRHHSADGSGISGLVVVSGRVRADSTAANPNARKVEAYYGTDPATYDDRSPVSHVNASSVPTLIAFAEYENPLIDVYCLELAYRLAAAKGRSPTVLRLAHHNHTSTIAHLNSGYDVLGEKIVVFMNECETVR